MLYRQPRRGGGDSAATSSQTGLRERRADASQQIFTAAADACSIGRRSLTVLPCYGRASSRSWRHAASWTFNTKTSNRAVKTSAGRRCLKTAPALVILIKGTLKTREWKTWDQIFTGRKGYTKKCAPSLPPTCTHYQQDHRVVRAPQLEATGYH